MLKVRNLNVSYNDLKVIENINFTVNQGELIVFLGLSGAGKTSIFNTIANLINYNGDITFNNKPIINKEINIAMSTQNFDLYNFKTVYQNVTLGLKLKKMPIDRERIKNLLQEVGLWEHRNKYPAQLSGGQKQRVSLIRSVTTNPELFLLDEPFSALDYFTREQMQDALLKYLEKQKCCTILITHSIEEALYLGDKIYILGGLPSTINKVFENRKGRNRTDKTFLEDIVVLRKMFNI